eukprot:300830-Prymnesium_polylepis.1
MPIAGRATTRRSHGWSLGIGSDGARRPRGCEGRTRQRRCETWRVAESQRLQPGCPIRCEGGPVAAVDVELEQSPVHGVSHRNKIEDQNVYPPRRVGSVSGVPAMGGLPSMNEEE